MKHNKAFFTLIILSIVISTVRSFFRVEAGVVLVIIQFIVIILAVFTLTEAYHKMVAKYLWSRYCYMADWEYVDRVDTYCTEYNVTLEVFGYSFFGCGVNSAGEKEICDIVCACPDGKVVVII